MKCYLHIGTEKTGTTAIQNFLNLNREKLSKCNYTFTKSAGTTNNWKLALAAYSPERRDYFTKKNRITSDNSLKTLQDEIIKELTHEIGKTSRQSVIFSSEHIHSRLTNISEIKRLKQILIQLGMKKFFIIIYLRNPADAANSLYSTAIKAGNTIEQPHPPNNPYYNNLCNHKATIEKYTTIFGSQSIIPRLYDRDDFHKGSIVHDLTNIIGIPWSEDFTHPKEMNNSLSMIGLEILRRFNTKVPVFNSDNTINIQRKNIVYYCEQAFKGEKYAMPDHLRHMYEVEFKGSNEWVREHFFPDKRSLFPQSNHSETLLGATDIELEQITDLLVSIWTSRKQ